MIPRAVAAYGQQMKISGVNLDPNQNGNQTSDSNKFGTTMNEKHGQLETKGTISSTLWEGNEMISSCLVRKTHGSITSLIVRRRNVVFVHLQDMDNPEKQMTLTFSAQVI